MSDWRQDMLLTAGELARLHHVQRALLPRAIDAPTGEDYWSASMADAAPLVSRSDERPLVLA